MTSVQAMAREPNRPVQGRIVYKASVANAGRLMIRLEVPNPNARPAGETVTVRFPGPSVINTKMQAAKETSKPEETANKEDQQERGNAANAHAQDDGNQEA